MIGPPKTKAVDALTHRQLTSPCNLIRLVSMS